MADFYTVDRLGTLRSGHVLDLTNFSDIKPPELQAHVDAMFPAGVSRHGNEYFLKSSSLAGVANPSIELLFEYVRRASFPERPSRFQSWFAVESVDEAKVFRDRFGNGKGTIWRVTSENVFRANMNLLTLRGTALVCSWYAHSYWRGESGPGGTAWEFLLAPPVHVIGIVGE